MKKKRYCIHGEEVKSGEKGCPEWTAKDQDNFMKPKKKLVRIGWVPYCIRITGNRFVASPGFWPMRTRGKKCEAKKDMESYRPECKFKILPVYAEVPRK